MIDCERNNDSFIDSLNSWARVNKIPLSLTMELTPFCNFNCVMCYVRLSKEQADVQGKLLTVQQWLDIAKQAKSVGTLNVTLTGGEPFLYPGFWELYEKLNQMGFILSILSNGSLIDEGVIEKFRAYGMPSMVKMTIYGASDETYQKVSLSSDGFTRISKAIDLLKAENVPVVLTSTIIKENADDLKLMYEFSGNKGVSLKHSISVVKSSRGAENSVEASRFAFADFSAELSLEYLEQSKYKWTDDPFGFCVSKGNSLFITWNGHFQLCSFLSKPYVKYSGDFEKDFKKLNYKLDRIINPTECYNCIYKEFCQRCPAILCAESGDPERVDVEFCKMAKRLYEIYKLKKGI